MSEDLFFVFVCYGLFNLFMIFAWIVESIFETE